MVRRPAQRQNADAGAAQERRNLTASDPPVVANPRPPRAGGELFRRERGVEAPGQFELRIDELHRVDELEEPAQR